MADLGTVVLREGHEPLGVVAEGSLTIFSMAFLENASIQHSAGVPRPVSVYLLAGTQKIGPGIRIPSTGQMWPVAFPTA